jgi:starch phosphorylase
MKDYFQRYYVPQAARTERLKANSFQVAKDIAVWKEKVLSVWDELEVIDVQLSDGITNTYKMGQAYPSRVTLNTKGLTPDEIGVEVIVGTGEDRPQFVERHQFKVEKVEDGLTYYVLDLKLTKPGTYNYGLRVFPKNPELPNRQDFRFLKWI